MISGLGSCAKFSFIVCILSAVRLNVNIGVVDLGVDGG